MKTIAKCGENNITEGELEKILSDQNFLSRKQMKQPGKMTLGSHNGIEINLTISWAEYQKFALNLTHRLNAKIKIQLKDYKKRNRRKRKRRKKK